jgi:hypothetical protein
MSTTRLAAANNKGDLHAAYLLDKLGMVKGILIYIDAAPFTAIVFVDWDDAYCISLTGKVSFPSCVIPRLL